MQGPESRAHDLQGRFLVDPPPVFLKRARQGSPRRMRAGAEGRASRPEVVDGTREVGVVDLAQHAGLLSKQGHPLLEQLLAPVARSEFPVVGTLGERSGNVLGQDSRRVAVRVVGEVDGRKGAGGESGVPFILATGVEGAPDRVAVIQRRISRQGHGALC